MKLSTSKWLAFLGTLTSRTSPQLNERQATSVAPKPTTAAINMFPAPLGTFILPPGPQTLVISENTLHVVEIFTSTTITTTWYSTAWFLTTEGPIIYYPAQSYYPGATMYIEGDPSILVTATATIPTTESVLTSTACSSSVCSPTPTTVDYTCGVSNGVTLPVTTVMQSFSCTTGQVCEGVAVKTTLNCNCGGPICTTVLPFIPIPPIVIPVGAPIPPAVPGPPEVPEEVPDPEITITEDPTVSEAPTSTSDENSDEPETSTSSDTTSTDTSSTSSSTSSTSSSTSSTSSSSNSTASACPIGGFSIPADFDATLSAWVNQFPFTLPATYSSNTTSTTSKPLTASFSTSVVTSSTTNTPSPSSTPAPTPTPTPSQTPTSGPKSTSESCNAACSVSSASSAFEASLSASMVAGHSSFTQSLSGALSSQSASILSAQQAQSAISKCQHYTLSYPWNPPDIPATLATYHGNSNGGRWMCVIDPTQIDTSAEWNSTWDYQPFGIQKSWDRNNPKNTLVDTFCDYLVNEHANVTALGDVQGVCQAYDLGQCVTPTRSGGCTYWQHPWTTLDTWGPVMISVAYDRDCPTDKNSRPVNFRAVGADGCKKSLNALVNSCSFPRNKQKNWAEDDPTVGGTIWSDCMVYTMIGIKEDDKPQIIWQD